MTRLMIGPTVGLALVSASSLGAQATAPRIPLDRGLAFVQTLHTPDAERESLVTVDDASPEGVRYVWRFLEVHKAGDSVRFEVPIEVSAADLRGAPRWLDVYDPRESPKHPGFTTYTLSTDVYRQLMSDGVAMYQVKSFAHGGIGGKLAALGIAGPETPLVVARGSLMKVSTPTEPFPLMVNGRRVTVPALHTRGEFTSRGAAPPWKLDVWFLADSAHPLLLKLVHEGGVLQTVRVDMGDDRGVTVERTLVADCRVELPGIYFAFNSAALDPASERALESVASVLARHPDWSATIEGHTDNIGSASSNQQLSERRAEAVKARLVAYKVSAQRLNTSGYGASRPREPNATIEGRARNRRVELVRACGGKTP